MSLQIGAALREAAARLVSRTGAILLAAYLVFMGAILPVSNTMIARLYARAGLSEVATQLPLTLDVPLAVAGGLYVLLTLFATYVGLVATRTFVARADDAFPEGALTRNVPLAMVNIVVGGFVYGLAVFVGSIFLLVPGIIAYLAFLFMMPYIAVEDRNFVAALRESYRLSRGHWLMLFVLVVILVGISAVIGGVSGLVFGLLLPLSVSQFVTVFIQAPISLYLLAVIAAVFNQLREDERPEAGGVAPTTDTPSTPV